MTKTHVNMGTTLDKSILDCIARHNHGDHGLEREQVTPDEMGRQHKNDRRNRYTRNRNEWKKIWEPCPKLDALKAKRRKRRKIHRR